MKNPVLASESFSSGKTHYFMDVRVASNHAIYFLFTQSSQLPDGSYKRNSIPVWLSHIHNFVTGFSSLLHSAAYLEQQDVTIHQLREQNQQKAASGIKAMEPAMRPREKLLLNGAQDLSNAEILALLIGSGSVNESAIALAGNILALVGDDPKKLDALDFGRLCRLKGMGLAKSSAVLAAIELSRRMHKQESVLRPFWVYDGTGGH